MVENWEILQAAKLDDTMVDELDELRVDKKAESLGKKMVVLKVDVMAD